MSLLINIPWVLSGEIISEWIVGTRILGIIDVAIGKKTREQYHQILSSISCNSEVDSPMDHFWILNRGVRISSLDINSAFCSVFQQTDCVQYPLERLQKLSILGPVPHYVNINALLQQCYLLNTFIGYDPILLDQVPSSVLVSLRHLTLKNIKLGTTLKPVALHCRHLKSIHLEKHAFDDISCYKNIIMLNLELEYVKLIGVYDYNPFEIIEYSVRTLPHLTYVSSGGSTYSIVNGHKAVHLKAGRYGVLASFFTSVDGLHAIEVYGASLSDAALEAISVHSAVSLQALRICALRSEEGLVCVLQRCKQLEFLEIDGWRDTIDMGQVLAIPLNISVLILLDYLEFAAALEIVANFRCLTRFSCFCAGVTQYQVDSLQAIVDSIQTQGRNLTCEIVNELRQTMCFGSYLVAS